jgi:hypothetical protein
MVCDGHQIRDKFLETLEDFHKKAQLLLDKIFNKNVITLPDISWNKIHDRRENDQRMQELDRREKKKQKILFDKKMQLQNLKRKGLQNLLLREQLLQNKTEMGIRKNIKKTISYVAPERNLNYGINDYAGTMPSGSMTVNVDSIPCKGLQSLRSIVIHYEFSHGVQKKYFPSPGKYPHSADLKAYIPDTTEGCKLLKRLAFAFSHGLLFSVGTCSLNGRPDSVFLEVVEHQYNPSVYDPLYISRTHRELSRLQVPSSNSIEKIDTDEQQQCNTSFSFPKRTAFVTIEYIEKCSSEYVLQNIMKLLGGYPGTLEPPSPELRPPPLIRGDSFDSVQVPNSIRVFKAARERLQLATSSKQFKRSEQSIDRVNANASWAPVR